MTLSDTECSQTLPTQTNAKLNNNSGNNQEEIRVW